MTAGERLICVACRYGQAPKAPDVNSAFGWLSVHQAAVEAADSALAETFPQRRRRVGRFGHCTAAYARGPEAIRLDLA